MVGNGKHSDSYFFSLPVLDNELKLFCWVVDRSEDPFSVDITITKTVDDLKKAIKMEMELDGPAHAFTLWKASAPISTLNATTIILCKVDDIPVDRTLKEKLINLKLDDKESLLPVTRLSEVFSNPPKDKHLHIIMRATGEFYSLCVIFA